MLPRRYCLKQCFKFSRLLYFKSLDYAVGIQKIQTGVFNNKIKHILKIHFGNIDIEKDLIQCRTLYHLNIEYRESAVYIVDLMKITEQPIFIQIVSIIKTNEK